LVKIRLDEIFFDEEIYPRRNVSNKIVEQYLESLKAGEKFPPLEVQKVNYDGEVRILSLDGKHRVEAYTLYNKLDGVTPVNEVEVNFWRDEVLDIEKDKIDLMIRSAELNIRHGHRLSSGDVKSQLVKIAEITEEGLRKDGFWNDVAKRFGVTPQWVSNCVSGILTRRKMSRNAFMYKLSLLGWKQKEIGELVGMEQPHVSENIRKLNYFKNSIISDFYDKGKSAEEIAEYYQLDLPLTWAIILEGKTDLERFELFGKSEYGNDQPKMTDYWKFGKKDPRLGLEYEGRLWGQDVMNILYRYSKRGDLVVDPMAGGGTTIDTCLIMGRKCRGYDIRPVRKDIVQWDIRNGYPEKIKNCDLIIFDPPYYKKKEKEYNSESITKDRETFIDFVKKFANDSFKVLKKNGYLAMIYSQYIDYEDEEKSILGSDLVKLFENNGFRCVLKIQSPLIFDVQYKPYDVERAKTFEPWRILPVSRDWYIFKK